MIGRRGFLGLFGGVFAAALAWTPPDLRRWRKVEMHGGGGHGATAVMYEGDITTVSIVDSGVGYKKPPTFTICGDRRGGPNPAVWKTSFTKGA
jgi:hypothetical protein